jgi:hypothetical protein
LLVGIHFLFFHTIQNNVSIIGATHYWLNGRIPDSRILLTPKVTRDGGNFYLMLSSSLKFSRQTSSKFQQILFILERIFEKTFSILTDFTKESNWIMFCAIKTKHYENLGGFSHLYLPNQRKILRFWLFQSKCSAWSAFDFIPPVLTWRKTGNPMKHSSVFESAFYLFMNANKLSTKLIIAFNLGIHWLLLSSIDWRSILLTSWELVWWELITFKELTRLHTPSIA